jgi:molecular chaperone DnaK
MAEPEKAAIEQALNEMLTVYCSDDHVLIRAHIEKLNQATLRLAEVMMNTAVRTALKGTKV